MEATIITDYIPWRLHSTNKLITYEQALFLLEGSIKGFRELLHKTKIPFLVEKYMIGVDGYGAVRVWWNENIFRNKFSFNLSSDLKLRDMILSLVNSITSSMDIK